MSSSLPVPSKAALTALRGLVVGTSCTLALIAEDRRRKINNAMRVIENGERIKSAKAYRPGGAALAVAMEEEALWDPRFALALHQHHDTEEVSRPKAKRKRQVEQQIGVQLGERDEVESLPEAPATPPATALPTESERIVGSQLSDANDSKDNNITDSHANPLTQKRPRPINPPLPRSTTSPISAPSWAWSNSEIVRAYSFPTLPDIEAKVHEACEAKDPLRIATAWQTVLKAMEYKVAPDNLDRSWMETTALLCRTCQEEGWVDGAAKVLHQVISRGPLEESDYLRHEPFPLIESLLARSTLHRQPRDADVANLNAAVNLFLPKFKDEPTGVVPQTYSLGRRLLELCFSHRLQRIFDVYRRCKLVAGDDSNDLTSWFLTKLYEKQDYVSVINIFVSNFAQSSPTPASLQAVGDLVVESVELAHNHRPAEVLQTLHSACLSLDTKLEPNWLTRLFTSHWKKHADFQEIEALFEQLQAAGLRRSVFRSDVVYRIMVQLAIEAGEVAKAETYFNIAVDQNPALASDVRLLGILARFHAADGDWDAVRGDFEAMNQSGTPTSKAYGQAFVPVLKAYAESHTVRETEAFLKSYTDELKVPLCSYMVTLMSKQYGAIRDVSSLIDWLDYCSQAGFPVDAAFTNSVLVRCRRQWKFPFRDLRSLFRKIRALNPDFIDKHTEKVMADAAREDSRHGGKAARGRLLSLRIDANVVPAKGKHAPVEDVILAMKEALQTGFPRRALNIYKRAFHLSMPFSEQALRLAVQAHLTLSPDDYNGAYTLLCGPQSAGEDVTPIINYMLGKQLTSITSTATRPSQVESLIEETLTQYRKAGIRLTETSLHRAALTCLAAGHPRGAIAYAHQAAALAPGGTPCFNLHNFKILLAAYAELVDARGLRDTITRGLASHYREDGGCRRALRHARDRVARARVRAVSEEERKRARAVVDEGIERVVEARRKLRNEARYIEREAVRIMRRAAADAGCEVVDFGEVAWLGGGKAAKVGAGEREGGKGKAAGKGTRAVKDKGPNEGDDEFLVGGYYADLERALLEGGRAAVEAF